MDREATLEKLCKERDVIILALAEIEEELLKNPDIVRRYELIEELQQHHYDRFCNEEKIERAFNAREPRKPFWKKLFRK